MSNQQDLFNQAIDEHKEHEVIHALWFNQPYASLMLHGKVETRTYPTKVRGEVLICACKKVYTQSDIWDISGDTHYTSGKSQCDRIYKILEATKLGIMDYPPVFKRKLPLGQAIAIGTLTDCRPMTKEDEDACFVQYREPWEVKTEYKVEIHVPYYNIEMREKKEIKRLWCWIFENVRPIEPFEIKGKQGWAIIDQATKDKIIYLQSNFIT